MHGNFIYSLLLFPVVSKAGKGSNETCCPIQACAGKIIFRCSFLLFNTRTICLNLCFSYAVSVGPLQSDSVYYIGLKVCFVGVTAVLITCN